VVLARSGTVSTAQSGDARSTRESLFGKTSSAWSWQSRRRLLGQLLAVGLLLVFLAGCGSGPAPRRDVGTAPSVGDLTPAQTRNYAPPGPPNDPWGPYIREASQRFHLPEPWIRAVMQQESGGKQYRNGELTTSSSGACGLMQLLPETYAELRQRYGLGPDPYQPRDNILAGTAYLHELYQRFGSPAFLAAYSGGPQRLTEYLTEGRPLTDITVAYVASVGPRIGAGSTIAGGTRTMVASASPADTLNRQALAAANRQSGTSYRALPDAPPPPHPTLAAAPVQIAALPPPVQIAAFPAPVQIAALPAASDGVVGSGWGIQVGAFSTPALAQAAAESVRAHAGAPLNAAHIVVPVTVRPDGVILYRARLLGLAPDQAGAVCNALARDRISCVVVAEERV
jgi:D-alanyl-D-alanine carboxypeptidase